MAQEINLTLTGYRADEVLPKVRQRFRGCGMNQLVTEARAAMKEDAHG